MKKDKKRALFYITALAVITLMIFAGCGGSDSDPELSSNKDITSFSIGGRPGVINPSTSVITVTVPMFTDLNNLGAISLQHTGASSTPNNGASNLIFNNSTNSQSITITAEDGTTKVYTVKINISQFMEFNFTVGFAGDDYFDFEIYGLPTTPIVLYTHYGYDHDVGTYAGGALYPDKPRSIMISLGAQYNLYKYIEWYVNGYKVGTLDRTGYNYNIGFPYSGAYYNGVTGSIPSSYLSWKGDNIVALYADDFPYAKHTISIEVLTNDNRLLKKHIDFTVAKPF